MTIYSMHMSSEIGVTIDVEAIQQAMRRQGIDSVKELADRMGLHRNTLGAYLSGNRGLPEALEKLLITLNLSPGEALKLSRPSRKLPALSIKGLIHKLQQTTPDGAFVLFGSRARGTAKKYSDYDLGVYRDPGVSLDEYSKLLTLVAEWNSAHSSTTQLTNLNNADKEFLNEIREDLIFIGGDFQVWCNLLRASGVVLHE